MGIIFPLSVTIFYSEFYPSSQILFKVPKETMKTNNNINTPKTNFYIYNLTFLLRLSFDLF